MTLEPHEVETLLDKLCSDLGFCLPSDEHKRISSNPPDDVIAFVDAVFIAEGMNPGTADRHVYRRVRDYVSAAFKHAQIRLEPGRSM